MVVDCVFSFVGCSLVGCFVNSGVVIRFLYCCGLLWLTVGVGVVCRLFGYCLWFEFLCWWFTCLLLFTWMLW